jgi:uncharacterized protein YjiS (DUF1127 family)
MATTGLSDARSTGAEHPSMEDRMSARQQIVRAAPESGSAGGFAPFVKIAADGWAWVMRCSARVAERRSLAQLPDWQLRDLGISRAEADAEAAKWFWRR